MIDKHVKTHANYNEFDRISWPGTSKDFKNVKGATLISLKLHAPDMVIIYEHEDCGAYGEDNSIKTHKKNAKRLEKAIKTERASIKVKTMIATFDGVKEL